MTAWIDVPAAAVGQKLTAAGFGLAVDTAVLQLQDETDLDRVREWARPGGDVDGGLTTGAPVTVSGAGTTLVSGPGAGRRVVKGLTLWSASAGSDITLALAGTTWCRRVYGSAGVDFLALCLPISAGETLTASVTAGSVVCTPTYADRADAVVDRFGIGSSSGTLTLVAAGAARTVTQLWIANTTATATTGTVRVGGVDVWSGDFGARTSVLIDDPRELASGASLQVVSSGASTLAAWASGY